MSLTLSYRDLERRPIVKARSFSDRWHFAIAYSASHLRGGVGNLKAVADLPYRKVEGERKWDANPFKLAYPLSPIAFYLLLRSSLHS